MTQPRRSQQRDKALQFTSALRKAWRVMLDKGPSQFQFWLIALIIGIAAGFAALLFRKAVTFLMGQEGREESFREFIVSCIRYNATMFRNRNGYNVVFMCIFVRKAATF